MDFQKYISCGNKYNQMNLQHFYLHVPEALRERILSLMFCFTCQSVVPQHVAF